jgi:hypothetical protein
MEPQHHAHALPVSTLTLPMYQTASRHLAQGYHAQHAINVKAHFVTILKVYASLRTVRMDPLATMA